MRVCEVDYSSFVVRIKPNRLTKRVDCEEKHAPKVEMVNHKFFFYQINHITDSNCKHHNVHKAKKRTLVRNSNKLPVGNKSRHNIWKSLVPFCSAIIIGVKPYVAVALVGIIIRTDSVNTLLRSTSSSTGNK